MGKDGLKVYVRDFRFKLSSVFELDGRVGTNEVKAVFPESRRPFDFPKPTGLIEELLAFTTREDDLILDSFAGSGTTGQAIWQLNSRDSGRRRFVLVEMEPSIARDVTSERLRRVSCGFRDSKGQDVEGLGSGFRFAVLGQRLFDEHGRITDKVTYVDLARHVYFMETGEPLHIKRKPRTPFLGHARGTGVYLLYNGILQDKTPGGGNVLTRQTLALLPEWDGPRVVYGTACRLSAARLNQHNITFRQIPYEIKVD